MASVFLAQRFTRSHDGAFVAEASDLGFRAGDPMPDAISVVGAGRFYYLRTNRDSDGDVQSWVYSSHALQSVVIFND
jgi:hypothetical protein